MSLCTTQFQRYLFGDIQARRGFAGISVLARPCAPHNLKKPPSETRMVASFYGLNCVAHRDAKAVKSCYNSISAFGIVSCTGTQTDTDRKNPLPLHPVQAKLQIQLQMRFHEPFRFVCVMSSDGIVDFLMLLDQQRPFMVDDRLAE